MTDDEESNLIKSFFVNEKSSTLTERKWYAPVFEKESLENLLIL